MNVKATLVLALLTVVVSASGGGGGSGCAALDCDICCRPSDPPVCVNDTTAIDCEMRRDPNLKQLAVLLIVLLGFLIGSLKVLDQSNTVFLHHQGLPVLLFLCEKILMHKPFSSSMSLCELFANYICCCICVNRRSRKSSKATKPKEQKKEDKEAKPHDDKEVIWLQMIVVLMLSNHSCKDRQLDRAKLGTRKFLLKCQMSALLIHCDTLLQN